MNISPQFDQSAGQGAQPSFSCVTLDKVLSLTGLESHLYCGRSDWLISKASDHFYASDAPHCLILWLSLCSPMSSLGYVPRIYSVKLSIQQMEAGSAV